MVMPTFGWGWGGDEEEPIKKMRKRPLKYEKDGVHEAR